MIIGLPDTQYYSENGQGSGSGQGNGDIATFIAQTNWIVNNRVDSNIVYVAHLGDCVENGDEVEAEWIRAADAIGLLEDNSTTGLTDGIPFGIAVGNHDMTPWDDDNNTSTTNYYNQYFGISHFSGRNYYGGHYQSNNDNHYDLFAAGDLKFIVIYIKYAAYINNQSVLNWADSLLSAYGDRYGIIVSHRLLKGDATFYPDGQAIFDAVKNKHNVFLMLCGHVTDEANKTDINGSGNGRNIYTLLSDYQNFPNGGNGYLRIMRFSPTADKINVYTYSPTLGAYRTVSKSQFVLNYDFTNPLPVELAFFTGSTDGNNIELRWKTETEVSNYGFDIERSQDGEIFLKIGFVEGHGNSNSPKDYSFIDKYPHSGKIYYRLKQIDNDGGFDYSDIIDVDFLVPSSIVLSQNYPNPFNPVSTIEYSLPTDGFVSLKVYDVLGREVASSVNEIKVAGKYSIDFNGSELSSGIYIYTLKSENNILSEKMILLK
jgi:hypothetical protein